MLTQVLTLSNCGIKSWGQIQALERYLPNIVELSLAMNPLGHDLLAVLAETRATAELAERIAHLEATSATADSRLGVIESQVAGLQTSVVPPPPPTKPMAAVPTEASDESPPLYGSSFGERLDLVGGFKQLKVLDMSMVRLQASSCSKL